jgi:hypothetical protein
VAGFGLLKGVGKHESGLRSTSGTDGGGEIVNDLHSPELAGKCGADAGRGSSHGEKINLTGLETSNSQSVGVGAAPSLHIGDFGELVVPHLGADLARCPPTIEELFGDAGTTEVLGHDGVAITKDECRGAITTSCFIS